MKSSLDTPTSAHTPAPFAPKTGDGGLFASGAPVSERLASARVPGSFLSVRTDPAALPDTPQESGGLFELVSRPARKALMLGLATQEPSFHVFVAADDAVMIEDDVVHFAERYAAPSARIWDIVYVHDFDHPEAPRPLLIAPGGGPKLVSVMEELIESLEEEIPALVEREDLREAQATLAAELEAKNKAVIGELESTAKGLGFGVRSVKGGVQTFPLLHGKPVSAEQFDVLDESTRKALADAESRLTREVEKAAQLVRVHGAGFEEAQEETFARAAQAVIEAACAQARTALEGLGPEVLAYLERVERALIEDWMDLAEAEEGEGEGHEKKESGSEEDPELATRLNRFRVNLLIAHDPGARAPVVYETNPTYPKLFGYLERRARFGALLTDFTRIRPGSLHKAYGGVLVVRAADLLQDPIIWERMKRVLREQKLGAEDPLGPLGLYATTLRPVPVPIHVRVVLVGPPELYAALVEADADFAALFRIKVEVDSAIPRTPDSLAALDAYLMNLARERGWGTFERAARARLLDLATRLAGDRDKLALLLLPLEETAAFASALARSNGEGAAVTAEDVTEAWHDRRERLGAAERHLRELTLRGEVALDTDGTRVGVVNGLSVYSTGDVDFGQPMRITAVVGIGREGIVDVEREARLGGSIHTKGVAIVRGYLSRMFGQERPLSLRAQLAFEQSYGEIEGDSASSSELFAVLSALAEIPIHQSIAVTGSVNQLGEMQAIGGLCAKIEGFFDLCASRGLTGRQGVLMPRANLPHLVLRDDVAEAVEQGRFHLFAVETVAQGIEVLTGVPAGERDAMGRFPASSVFGRVERRLIEIGERLREAEGHGPMRGGRDLVEDVSRPDLEGGGDFRPPRN